MVVVAGAGALAVATFLWWPSEERAVRRRLDALATALSVPANPGDLGRVTRVAELGRYFTPDVRVRASASGPEIASREALVGALATWTPPPGGWTIEFVDVQTTLGADQASAQVHLTAKVSGRDARTGEATLDAREANVLLLKQSGDWLIARVDAVDTLQRP